MPLRQPSPARAAAEAAILIPFAFGGIIAIGWSLTQWLALPSILRSPFEVLGWPIVAAGAVSLARAGQVLSAHGRGTPYPRRPPRSLVTTGPYARVRNPIFLAWGTVLFGLGIGLQLPGLVLLLVPAAVAIHVYIVYHEEPILARRFGAEFEAYRRRVPRWIPRLRT